MSSENKFVRLSVKLSSNIEAKRYEHTMAVVTCAKNLAQIYKVNIDKTEIAALLHDCGREVKVADSPLYALRNGLKVNKIERLQPILLHAKIGRLLAKKKYGIKDKRILEAITCHTTGKPNMSKLSMVIYIADMLEASRTFEEADYLRSLIGNVSLQELMLRCVHATLAYLLNSGLFVHIDSIKTYNSLLALIKKEKSQIVGSV